MATPMMDATVENLHKIAQRLLGDGDVSPHPTRVTFYDKARAWIRVAPRDSVQLGELLGISTAHAATILIDLRQWGEIEPTGPTSRNGRPPIAYRMVTHD